MSIQGIGNNNTNYTSADRFHSVQFGVSVPLFFFSQQGKINSAEVQELITENEYQIGVHTLQNEYQTAFKQYQHYLQTVQYFENTALKNADIITETANRQFASGDINYLEWVMLINNAISIQSNYVDVVKELNQTIIHLNYLTTN